MDMRFLTEDDEGWVGGLRLDLPVVLLWNNGLDFECERVERRVELEWSESYISYSRSSSASDKEDIDSEDELDRDRERERRWWW